MRLLARDDCLWRRFAAEYSLLENVKSRYKNGGIQDSWKEVYRFGEQWKNGTLKPTRPLLFRQPYLMPWLQMNSQEDILMTSQGTEICSYSIPKLSKIHGNQEQCLSRLRGHTDDVVRFIKHGSYVYSASLDKTVRIWAVGRKSRCMGVLHGHSNGVYCVDAERNVVISGSRDCTLKIWSKFDHTCLVTIPTEDLPRSLCLTGYKSQFLVGMAAHNRHHGALRVYDLNRGRMLYGMTSNGSEKERLGAGILQLKMEDAHTVLTCGYDTTLRLWDLRTRRCVRSWMDPHDNAIFCMESNRDWMLLSGANRFGLVRLWDKRMSAPIRSFYTASKGNGSPVYSLKYSQDGLFVAISSGIQILNFV
eukprot:Seg1716.18 transcript_id=Seg1716.18/GoldUCD/mRNA.D3Y31 product="F-box/WD repeat-containing protein 4" protein_id=Seg1716.18/GoldUCD/D3Y31